MEQKRTIAGEGAYEVWQQINADFNAGTDIHNYHVLVNIGNQNIDVDIVSSPGGSEEGGYDTTRLSAHLVGHRGFHFAIHPEDFLNKIGKLFGMEDVTTGYTEFDKNVIVKTNDVALFKNIFADAQTRQVFETLSGYSFKVVPDDDKTADHLELYIQRGITDAAELEPVFNAFCNVVSLLNQQ